MAEVRHPGEYFAGEKSPFEPAPPQEHSCGGSLIDAFL